RLLESREFGNAIVFVGESGIWECVSEADPQESHFVEGWEFGICDRICWRMGLLGYAIAFVGELGIWGMR
ncbi:MAG: hypothetical protein HC903_25215, partial [Methylacidiphilales bacterium]|nr:hypothetical protein [Candidatus Methylacidiphilales bacterium]